MYKKDSKEKNERREEPLWMRKNLELLMQRNKIPEDIFNKIFHNEIIPLQSMQMHIEHYYKPKSEEDIRRIDRIMSNLCLNKNDKVLDIGCGTGTFVYHTSKLCSMAIGIDYSIGSVKRASEINKKFITNGKRYFVCADLKAIPLKESIFDKIVAADIIEHLSKRQKLFVFKEVYRVMKKEGVLVIGTPNGLLVKFSYFLMKLKTVKAKILGGDFPRPDITTASHIGLTDIFELKKLARNRYTVKTKYFIDNIPFISRRLGRFPNIISFLTNLLKKIPLIRDFFTTYIMMVMKKI